MQTVTTVAELRAAIKIWRQQGERIAFVPTMGNLHAGHLELVEVAKQHAERVVVSIFVNPSQFGVGEDFASYPRTEAQDQAQLHSVGADLLFLPGVADIYAADAKTTVSVNGLSELYCGAFRPGHFSGVATVVCKLFNCVQADVAVFGQKDFQQLAVIKTMVRDLHIPIDIIGVATVREASGLAMSSRNGYLSAAETALAAHLYQTLNSTREAILAGNRAYPALEQQATHSLQTLGFKVDYFTVCRSVDLAAAQVDDIDLVILTAARLGKTRLIDNLEITLPPPAQSLSNATKEATDAPQAHLKS